MDNNEVQSICRLCQGACCKGGAGGWFPEDLPPITIELILTMLSQGYQFDYWEGNPTSDTTNNTLTAYYLRPQHVNSIGKTVDASWGGQCIFLTDTGCSKSFDERPTQCRALVPDKSFNCNWDDKYSKRNIAIAWLPYNAIIEEALRMVP